MKSPLSFVFWLQGLQSVGCGDNRWNILYLAEYAAAYQRDVALLAAFFEQEKCRPEQVAYDQLKTLFDRLVLTNHTGFNGFHRVFMGQPVRYGKRSFIRLALGSYSIRKMMGADGFDPFNDLHLVDLIESTAVELFEHS